MPELIDAAAALAGLPAAVPILAHVPHAATRIPPEYRGQFVIPPRELQNEILRLTDWHTELFGEAVLAHGGARVCFPFSRFLVDPERYADDDAEPMSAVGMGVVYSRDTQGRRLRRRLSREERDELLTRIYRPYHALLERAASDLYSASGRLLFLDCHSYPSQPLPYELRPAAPRPDLCIGTCPGHSPDLLLAALQELAAAEGLTADLNTPFAGCLLPSALIGKAGVAALMLEVRRSAYMNEKNGRLHEGIFAIQRIIRGLCAQFVGC